VLSRSALHAIPPGLQLTRSVTPVMPAMHAFALAVQVLINAIAFTIQSPIDAITLAIQLILRPLALALKLLGPLLVTLFAGMFRTHVEPVFDAIPLAVEALINAIPLTIQLILHPVAHTIEAVFEALAAVIGQDRQAEAGTHYDKQCHILDFHRYSPVLVVTICVLP